MEQNYVECLELSGKSIQTLCIYKDTGNGTDVHIELTDGTSFICPLSHQPTVRASLYRGGVGTPQTIRDYETQLTPAGTVGQPVSIPCAEPTFED